MEDLVLLERLVNTLHRLEDDGEIVICSATARPAARKIHYVISTILPRTDLTAQELTGVRRLIFQAVADKRFFDWEMPTLTGFTAAQFEAIASKLPID